MKLKFSISLARAVISFLPDKGNVLSGLTQEIEMIDVALKSMAKNLNVVARYMADTSARMDAFRKLRHAEERWNNAIIKALNEIHR